DRCCGNSRVRANDVRVEYAKWARMAGLGTVYSARRPVLRRRLAPALGDCERPSSQESSLGCSAFARWTGLVRMDAWPHDLAERSRACGYHRGVDRDRMFHPACLGLDDGGRDSLPGTGLDLGSNDLIRNCRDA